MDVLIRECRGINRTVSVIDHAEKMGDECVCTELAIETWARLGSPTRY